MKNGLKYRYQLRADSRRGISKEGNKFRSEALLLFIRYPLILGIFICGVPSLGDLVLEVDNS